MVVAMIKEILMDQVRYWLVLCVAMLGGSLLVGDFDAVEKPHVWVIFVIGAVISAICTWWEASGRADDKPHAGPLGPGPGRGR